MSTLLTRLAAVALIGAATVPLSANAAERHANAPSTDVSSQRHMRGHVGGTRHYGGYHRGYRYGYGAVGPRYRYGGYYGDPYRPYGYYGGPYGYYRPGLAFGFGPFGFGLF